MTQDPFVTLPAARLILASSSQTRQNMLAMAGIAFTAQSAPVDEAGLRDAALAEDMTNDELFLTATAVYATFKAVIQPRTARRRPDAEAVRDCLEQWSKHST
ncbi:MAG: hypothetical protein ACPID7_06935, partial [Candidatus Puniceispirillum sp.]